MEVGFFCLGLDHRFSPLHQLLGSLRSDNDQAIAGINGIPFNAEVGSEVMSVILYFSLLLYLNEKPRAAQA